MVSIYTIATIAIARLQGNNPELSYEATEKVLIEEKLKAMELKRELQLLQARIAHNEAITKKATRVITKGIRRCRESRSSARLLETKLALASETQALGLLNTIDEKQEDLQRTQEEVSLFKELFLRTKAMSLLTAHAWGVLLLLILAHVQC